MPNIKGIDLSDGVKIVSGLTDVADLHLNAAAIKFYDTPEKATDAANKWLKDRFPEQVQVHVFTLDPLDVTCIVANNSYPNTGLPYTIPEDWWVR